MRKRFVYTGESLNEISFPLGGIGTGCIGVAGNGRLLDWEIFNRPSKGSTNGFSHFAVRAETGGRVLDTRVLQGDLPPPYTGSLSGSRYNSFGFGPPRETMAGLPHFRTVKFSGTFPIARLDFADASFPGSVSMTAWNPFIPLNDADSSIPAAFLEIEIRNTSPQNLGYSVFCSVRNPFPPRMADNRFCGEAGHAMITLGPKVPPDEPTEQGDITVATDATSVSWQEYWFRGSWFDNLSVYWSDLRQSGPLANRSYLQKESGDWVNYGKDDLCLLAAHLDTPPGERVRARFVIAWSFPNRKNSWKPPPASEAACCPQQLWKNHYATVFSDSRQSAAYALREWDRLWKATRAFRDALFSSTLPEAAVEAVSANLSVLKSPTVLRLEDGTFYGFEGCHPSAGCCEGSCSHVWNYSYATPFLFPKLERSMREADYRYNLRADSSMCYRLQLPLGRRPQASRPCADGQFGGVIKMFREWKICGDTAWLQRHWAAIKETLSFAWSDANPDRWDRDHQGVLHGRQHHTLDMELFGPNAWLTGMYLAALAAAAEMADALGEPHLAREYRTLFSRGTAWVDANLFNGEYYAQRIDLSDRRILEQLAPSDRTTPAGEPTVADYWDDEHRQIKYQIAEGCDIDQLLGQWHAHLVGLGRIFDRDQARSALASIYRYNFLPGMREHANPCRIFALNDERGVVTCSFPRGRPAIPVPYAEEVMSGFEYQVASAMIQEGLVREGLEIVSAIRDRYDGRKRNPWNEFECGSNYARSMASYALLVALSGFRFDMVRRHLGFHPVASGDRFRCFWCLEGAWGRFERDADVERLRVLYGNLTLDSFSTDRMTGSVVKEVRCGRAPAAFEQNGTGIRFLQPIQLREGRGLAIRY